MKFKCNSTGNVYTFEAELDIKTMLKSQDYTVVPATSATIVPGAPIKAAPDKPLPAEPVAPKAL